MFITKSALCCFLFLTHLGMAQNSASKDKKPNIIIIVTDDQGMGDLGYYGNKHIKTPTIDAFAKESVRFNNFFVSPVCAPTRASLLTGRNSLRTGVHDTYNGGAIMAANEITLAEILQKEGYATGMIGKWHLGDNYPSRPQDQGFNKTLYHLSGGIGQVGDWPNYAKKDSSYFNPVLWRNGIKTNSKGYCSDVFGDEAVKFIEENHKAPFFLYVAFNAPHGPFQVPQEYYDLYKDIDPSLGYDKENNPFPEMNSKAKEDARKVYGMVTNIDDNVAKVLSALKSKGIKENSLVLFMTDNGASTKRYNAGLRDKKGSVYQGGIRVPSFWRLPRKFKGNRDISVNAAHIDILPTIANLCNISMPTDRKIDGVSLLPLLNSKKGTIEKNRPIWLYWNRRYPELYNNMTLIKGANKFVAKTVNGKQEFGLYNIEKDPFELKNISKQFPEETKEMQLEMKGYYKEMIQSPNILEHPAAIIGTKYETETILNRNDAFGEEGIWYDSEGIFGEWDINILEEATYEITLNFTDEFVDTEGYLKIEMGSYLYSKHFSKTHGNSLTTTPILLPKFKGKIIPRFRSVGKRYLPFTVHIKKVG